MRLDEMQSERMTEIMCACVCIGFRPFRGSCLPTAGGNGREGLRGFISKEVCIKQRHEGEEDL